jgi:hypothetical protein
MRLGLNVGIPGEEKKNNKKTMITVSQYLSWVEHLPTTDAIKDKFRELVNRMPSTAYSTITENVNQYIRRFTLQLQKNKTTDYVKPDLKNMEFAYEENVDQEKNITEENASEEITREKEE